MKAFEEWQKKVLPDIGYASPVDIWTGIAWRAALEWASKVYCGGDTSGRWPCEVLDEIGEELKE